MKSVSEGRGLLLSTRLRDQQDKVLSRPPARVPAEWRLDLSSHPQVLEIAQGGFVAVAFLSFFL